MTDMLVLALLVLMCSVFVMFSQEFGDFVKKIMKIPGMKLFLPLIILTSLMEGNEPWALWGLFYIQWLLLTFVQKIASWLPFHEGALYVAQSLVLFSFSFLPVLAWDLWRQRTYQSFQYAYITSLLIWLFMMSLLILAP